MLDNCTRPKSNHRNSWPAGPGRPDAQQPDLTDVGDITQRGEIMNTPMDEDGNPLPDITTFEAICLIVLALILACGIPVAVLAAAFAKP